MTPATARAASAVASLAVLLPLALTACTAQDRAPSPQEVRRLAGGVRAQQARAAGEDRLRAVVRAYDERTPLALGLTAVDDTCAAGTAKQWFVQDDSDRYKVRCALRVTAYYGADPHRVADVLDGVFTAGDRDADAAGAPGGTVPFGHDTFRRRLVAYYAGRGPNPNGPDAAEPAQVSGPAQTLSWDSVRTGRARPVGGPGPCPQGSPPVSRCLREPKAASAAGIRTRYGMVFRLELSPVTYYSVAKNGATVTG